MINESFHSIKQHTRRIITRMQGLNYLHRGIVFSIDVFCSLAATLATIFLLKHTSPHPLTTAAAAALTVGITLLSTGVFLFFRFYKLIIRHSDLRSLPRIINALAIISALSCGIGYIRPLHDLPQALLCGLFYFLFSCCFIIGVRVLMVCTYYFIIRIGSDAKEYLRSSKVLIYGDTQATASLASYLNTIYRGTYLPVGFIDLEKGQSGTLIQGLPVYGAVSLEQLQQDIHSHVVDGVIFTSRHGLQREQQRLAEWCTVAGVNIYVTRKLSTAKADAPPDITPVNIEDLLERPEIHIEKERISAGLSGQTILVTGAAGSIGSELVRQLCHFSPARIVLLDYAETPLHHLRLEIEEEYPHIPLTALMADVRNRERCRRIISRWRPAVIFHAAAYKHVPFVEENPTEGIITNVQGTIHMAQLAQEYNVRHFVMISTDKAVNPTNVMGATKRAAEMYVQSLDTTTRAEGRHSTSYITTRFGNVLGSNGSVVPRFREQIARGGPVTVTHPDIIRYFMTIPEACRLVLQAAVMGHGGEIYVFDMGDPLLIAHLARRMIQLSGLEPDKDIRIEYTGLRPGEKLYEELLSCSESTTETTHHKIRIAHATDNTHATIHTQAMALIAAAESGDDTAAVRELKKLVPEFISNNSRWETLDASTKL